ncbi:hypothetical protein AB0G15_14800 [Streptosporangium sp. NPDC023825]|uniref:hypothetical protein n=1 Tax=Streptosporangium sp. NPDC023825 TaxID=3154909 RepID=UPI00344577B3
MLGFLFVAGLALVAAWPLFALAACVLALAAGVGAVRAQWRGGTASRRPAFWRGLAAGSACAAWATVAYGLTQLPFLHLDPDSRCPVYDGDIVFKRVPWDDPECDPVPGLVWPLAIFFTLAFVACLITAIRARRASGAGDGRQGHVP